MTNAVRSLALIALSTLACSQAPVETPPADYSVFCTVSYGHGISGGYSLTVAGGTALASATLCDDSIPNGDRGQCLTGELGPILLSDADPTMPVKVCNPQGAGAAACHPFREFTISVTDDYFYSLINGQIAGACTKEPL